MNIAFVGYRHGHTLAIYNEAMAHPDINVLGAWEETDEGKALAEGSGIEFNYSTLEELLADDRIDAVNLGGCYGDRGAHAIAALRAGKHVYSDKPLCTSIEELDEIERLAKKNNLKVGCYFSMRFANGIKTIRELILGGEIGEVGAINMTAQHPLSYGVRPMWYFQKGKHGGTINDIAIHGVDLVRFITGLGVKNVTAARTWNHFAVNEPQFCDCAQFMVELDNGAGFIADVSYAAPKDCRLETYWRFTIWGTNGVIEYKYNGAPKTENDDGVVVLLALDGSDGFMQLNKEKYDTKPINEFLKEINGEKTIITTADVLRSTRETLIVQEKALI